MSFIDLLSIVGGLVLFLYGIQTLGDGLKKVSGGKMEQILQSLTSNKWKAALLGTLVTAVIQSSGATIVMVVGFVNSGIMSLQQSVGVILGANIGTTITAWLLSLTGIESDNLLIAMFKPENFSPIIGIIGVFMMMLGKKERHKDIGGIMTSFAVLMLGMDAMSDGAAPLANDPKFTGLLTAFSNPFLGLLTGLAVTAILQSSSASIGILQSISLTGVLKMGSAIPVIMGENIGSAITGIMGAIGASRNAKRAALLQMVYCIIKTTTFMILFYALNAVFHFPIMEQTASPVTIAVFHSIFNIAAVLVILPISDILVKIVERLLPITEEEKADSESRKELRMLDTRFITSPSFALDQCKKATDKMASYTQEAIHTAIGLVLNYNEDDAARVDKLERTVDEYEDTLDSYLVTMTNMTFSAKDSHMFTLIMHVIGDFERMTDHSLNIMQSARDMHERDQQFSPKAQEELRIFNAALLDIVDRAVTAFQNVDLRLASTVEPLEEVIDGINMEEKRRHVRRLRKGKCTIELGIVLEDITTDYERIADHCNNIAVYLSQMNESGFEKHEYIEHLEDSAKTEFVHEAEEFEQKYQLPDQKKEDLDAETPAKDGKADRKAGKADKPDKSGKERKRKKDKK